MRRHGSLGVTESAQPEKAAKDFIHAKIEWLKQLHHLYCRHLTPQGTCVRADSYLYSRPMKMILWGLPISDSSISPPFPLLSPPLRSSQHPSLAPFHVGRLSAFPAQWNRAIRASSARCRRLQTCQFLTSPLRSSLGPARRCRPATLSRLTWTRLAALQPSSRPWTLLISTCTCHQSGLQFCHLQQSST